MKILIAGLTSIALVSAQDGEGDTRKFSHITAMAFSQVSSKTSHNAKQVNKMIQNYGCHCFPGLQKIAGGAGPAQDDYDSLCRDLARCHKCIEMDHVGELNDEWDANIGRYRWDLNADNSISCAANTEQHKMDLCTCDANYAMALGALWDDNTFDMTLWGGKKNNLFSFDYENTCTKSGTFEADECCGVYPERHPYDSTQRMCCDGITTYNDVQKECCDVGDGTIASTGSC